MKIFVITTPNDDLRASKLKTELDNQIEIEKFDIQPWSAIMDYGSPHIGISKTHRSIIQYAKDTDLSEVLILEDDVHFLCRNSLVRFLNLNLVIPKDADMVFAGIYEGLLDKEASMYGRVLGRLSGLHAYIVKSKFYDKFLNVNPEFNLDYALSTELSPVMYCANPFLIIQRDNEWSYNLRGTSSHNYKLAERYQLTNCE